MSTPDHPFDHAIALSGDDPGHLQGHTSEQYWNSISPFGGASTAAMLQAMLQHPERLGDPISLTVNFAGAIRRGEFVVQATPARTGRSTQHWQIALYQGDDPAPAMTGTAVFALRRETWNDTEAAMPAVAAMDTAARYEPPTRLPFLERYDIRYVDSQPFAGTDSSVTQSWIADVPRRPIDFASIAAYCDVFLPRVFVRKGRPSPIATVTMSINFHVGDAALKEHRWELALGQARGNVYHGGFHDQEAKVWAPDGRLLATTHQLVWFKEL